MKRIKVYAVVLKECKESNETIHGVFNDYEAAKEVAQITKSFDLNDEVTLTVMEITGIEKIKQYAGEHNEV